MRTAGVARALGAMVPAVSLADDTLAESERAEHHARIEEERRRIGVPLLQPKPKGVSDDDLARFGMACHELAHAAVAAACGDIVESVEIAHGTHSGLAPVWIRTGQSAGTIIAEIALRSAGAVGYERATGDVLGGYLGARGDREDVAELVARVELTKQAAADAQAVADRIVELVLGDREVWRSIVELAFRLMDTGRIAGPDVDAAIVIPGPVRNIVRRLVA